MVFAEYMSMNSPDEDSWDGTRNGCSYHVESFVDDEGIPKVRINIKSSDSQSAFDEMKSFLEDLLQTAE